MKLKIGLFFLALQLVLTIDQLPHYFHTTLQIIDQIEHLVQEC